MTKLTKEQLKDINDVYNNSTQGEWYKDEEECSIRTTGEEYVAGLASELDFLWEDEDESFILCAHKNIPLLLEHIEDIEKELAHRDRAMIHIMNSAYELIKEKVKDAPPMPPDFIEKAIQAALDATKESIR